MTVLRKDKLVNDHQPIQNYNSTVLSADGKEINITGITNVKMTIGNQSAYLDVLVAETLTSECLLGMDVLSTNPNFKFIVSNLQQEVCKSTLITETHRDKLFSRITNTTQTSIRYILATVKSVFEQNMTSLSSQIENIIKEIAADGLSTLKTTKLLEHSIKLVDNAKAIKQKLRKIPYQLKDDFKKTLDEMLTNGMIRPSNSDWCSPVQLVKKKDGSIRVTIDYTKLNNQTVKDCYPIPISTTCLINCEKQNDLRR